LLRPPRIDLAHITFAPEGGEERRARYGSVWF
jgi:hypothetical protein